MKNHPFRLFLRAAPVVMTIIVVLVLSACDNFNIPIKEKLAFYRAMTPVKDWDE
jgi:hypothetical protein